MARPGSFRDLQSEYAKDTASHDVRTEEARAVEDGAQVSQSQPYRTEQHHVFAQAYRDRFEREGIDIDRYTIDLDRDNHQDTQHPRAVEGNRNPEWNAFFAEHDRKGTQPTRDEMVAEAQSQMDYNGWHDHAMHAFNYHSQTTSLSELTQDSDLSSPIAAEVSQSNGQSAEAPDRSSLMAAEASRDSASQLASSTPAPDRDGPDGPGH
jgi:hypothetical protein